MREPNEIIEFDLSKHQLEEKLNGMMFETETNILVVKIKSELKSSPLRCNVDISSMKNTIQLVDEMVNGTLDKETKHRCIYCLRYHLTKYKIIKFNDSDRKWYSEAFPDDPTFFPDREQKQKRESKPVQPPDPEPQIQKMESVEEWQKLVKEKYWALKHTADENFPGLWFSLEFQLSVKTILNIKNCTLPFIGIILGRPGSQKTLGIELMRKEKYTYYTDSFSAKAFVSHSTAVSKKEIEEIDMLPKIKNKLFLTPELSPTFAKKDDDLKEIIGIITRIADGHGYKSDSGAHGGRGYTGEWMFTWIGAAVDIPHSVHKLLSTLGPKIYFIRVPKIQKSEKDYLKQLQGDEFAVKFKRVQDALTDYLRTFDTGPQLDFDKNTNLLKMPWNAQKEDENSLVWIIKLGKLLGHLRAYAPTWGTKDTQGTEYAYAMAKVEEPDRAIEQLRNLARAHALTQGRNYITSEDIPIVIKTVLSTASIERVNIFDLLLAHNGTLNTRQIELSLNLHEHVAHRTMAELKAVGLVNLDEGQHGNSIKTITLRSEFKSFLDKEFRKLREEFIPADYSEYLKKEKVEEEEEEEEEKDQVASRILPPYCPDNTEPAAEGEEDKGLRGNFSASKTEVEPKPKPRPQETCPICGEILDSNPYWAKHHNCKGEGMTE